MEQHPIIEINDVTFSYQNEGQPVLNGASARFFPGTITVICGPTGSGKTTLVRLLNGLIPHFYEGWMKGDVLVNGINTRDASTARLAQVVGMVFQNPDNQLVCSSCEREIAFGPENLGIPRSEIHDRVESAIQLLDLQPIREISPNELSGGQKQKVAIAAALALNPSVLVFDEPTSNLDPESITKLVSVIETIKTRLHSTIIIVEHRLEPFLKVATHMACMKDGKIIMHDKTENVIQDESFYQLGVQVPVVMRIFNQLRKERLHDGPIPVDMEKGLSMLQGLL
ncbi:MAG: ABC transporter ATP-binding protein [Candidatus Lokiarchaeota archaeon]|nr:ABC transporter ATP-binding protein [Candidatus Lokiarchaeota archaeon]